jgi:hypothetical protein
MVKHGTGGAAMNQKGKPPLWALRYLKDVGSVYQKIWMDQITTWDSALQKVESGKYSTGQFVSDVVRSWDQWARDLWLLGFPLSRWLEQGEQIPSVGFIVDDVAQCTDPKEVPLPLETDPTLPPQVAVTLTNNGGPLCPSNIEAKITDDCAQLSVRLKDLQRGTLPIAMGDHRALVYVHDLDKKAWTPLAAVEVLKVSRGP